MAYEAPSLVVKDVTEITAEGHNIIVNDVLDHETRILTTEAVWTAFTPTLTQSGAVAKTTDYARYVQFGKTVIGSVKLTASAAGTAANPVLVGLPVAARAGVGATVLGSAFFYDASTSVMYVLSAAYKSTTSVSFYHDTGGGSDFGRSGATAITIASGDTVSMLFHYEAA